MDHWAKVAEISMHAKTAGVALPLRFRFGAFKDYQARIRAHEPHVRIAPHPRTGMQGIFSGDVVRIETLSRNVIRPAVHSKIGVIKSGGII
jgi:hypothetical protein